MALQAGLGITAKISKVTQRALQLNMMTKVHTWLQQFRGGREGALLPSAHARGLNALGLSDEDLLRLYSASDADIRKTAFGVTAHAGPLDLTKDQTDAYQNLVTRA